MKEQFSDHVRYRVVVRGRLGEHLADAFGQLELDSQPGQTSLTGNFTDQAQLHGLLSQLADLGIHLISVNPVDQTPAPHSTRISNWPAGPGRSSLTSVVAGERWRTGVNAIKTEPSPRGHSLGWP